MSKVAIVYWSGSGNTEAMANEIANGVKAAGAEPVMFFTEDGKNAAEVITDCAGVAFGCPAMGTEELEDTVFLPAFEACKPGLGGKKVVLFGSYGWGDGEWMRTWEDTCKSAGINLILDSIICTEAPDDAAVEACRDAGKALA